MGRKHNRARVPFIMRLPAGLREQPAWVFIGILIGLSGLSALLGFTESTASQVIGTLGLRIWGAFLMLSGFAVVGATLKAAPALEKLALRVMSMCLCVYVGWLGTIVDIRRLITSAAFVLILVILAEIRIAVLRALLKGGYKWL